MAEYKERPDFRKPAGPPEGELGSVQLKKVEWTDIGSGGEAACFKGNPSVIEGIGGVLDVLGPLDAVKRVGHMSTSLQEGEKLFLKHLTAKILDDYFLGKGVYKVPHIPTPLGSFPGGYYYEYAVGGDDFPWFAYDSDIGREMPVDLAEFRKFTNAFTNAGINVGEDVNEVDDSRMAKNIVLARWNMKDVEAGSLPDCWRRIDFGSSSCPERPEKFDKFVESEAGLEEALGWKYELLVLAGRKSIVHETLSGQEEERLGMLVKTYRQQVLGRDYLAEQHLKGLSSQGILAEGRFNISPNVDYSRTGVAVLQGEKHGFCADYLLLKGFGEKMLVGVLDGVGGKGDPDYASHFARRRS